MWWTNPKVGWCTWVSRFSHANSFVDIQIDERRRRSKPTLLVIQIHISRKRARMTLLIAEIDYDKEKSKMIVFVLFRSDWPWEKVKVDRLRVRPCHLRFAFSGLRHVLDIIDRICIICRRCEPVWPSGKALGLWTDDVGSIPLFGFPVSSKIETRWLLSPSPSQGPPCVSPWYNRSGWLGVKHQVTYPRVYHTRAKRSHTHVKEPVVHARIRVDCGNI